MKETIKFGIVPGALYETDYDKDTIRFDDIINLLIEETGNEDIEDNREAYTLEYFSSEGIKFIMPLDMISLAFEFEKKDKVTKVLIVERRHSVSDALKRGVKI